MKVIEKGPEEYGRVKIGKLLIKTDKFVLLISITIASILFIIGILFGLYLDYITLAALIFVFMLVATLPYLVYRTLESSMDKKIEENYPSFLRDLSEALASGMTLVQALKHISKIDYGPLSKFIGKLYVWLSWGMDFVKAFEKFNKYFEGNPSIVRANYIILESYKEGGNIEKVLKTVADDLESIKELEKLKKTYVMQQVIVLYVIFFIFTGLIIMLKSVLAPMITQQLMLQSEQQVFATGSKPIEFQHFKFISSLAILIEGILIAFVIGVAESGRLSSGFKHLIVTLLASALVILVFILPEQVEVSLSVYPKEAYMFETISIDGRVTVDATPLDHGTVTLIIAGPDSVITTLDVNNGKFSYKFEARKRGEYTVTVRFVRKSKEYIAKDQFEVR